MAHELESTGVALPGQRSESLADLIKLQAMQVESIRLLMDRTPLMVSGATAAHRTWSARCRFFDERGPKL